MSKKIKGTYEKDFTAVLEIKTKSVKSWEFMRIKTEYNVVKAE